MFMFIMMKNIRRLQIIILFEEDLSSFLLILFAFHPYKIIQSIHITIKKVPKIFKHIVYFALLTTENKFKC